MSLYEKDSIVALATPRGMGALSVIRVSGSSLSDLLSSLVGLKKMRSRYVYYKKIKSSSDGKILDHSLISSLCISFPLNYLPIRTSSCPFYYGVVHLPIQWHKPDCHNQYIGFCFETVRQYLVPYLVGHPELSYDESCQAYP